MVASLKLKGIDGLAPQAVDFAVQLDPTPKNLLGQHTLRHDGLMTLHKCVRGGAWPHEVRGVTCLLNCDNGQDPHCMISGQCYTKGCVWCPGFGPGCPQTGGTEQSLTSGKRYSHQKGPVNRGTNVGL